MPETAKADTPIHIARLAAGHLEERGFENARLESELMLAAVLGLRRLDLYLQHDRPLTEAELEAFREAIRRRLRHEPVQYITGETQFRELTLNVDRRALIPRPETEALVGAVLDWAVEHAVAEGRGTRALDLGTGAGAIALSLAHEGGFERVVATDASNDALDLARENADRNGLADRIDFRAGDLWAAIESDEMFDAIVSNPPYVADTERNELPEEIREWEPEQALFGGADGLAVLDRVIDDAPRHLRPGGLLALEVGLGQAADVARRIETRDGYETPAALRDLTGRDRIVVAERTGNAN